MTSGIMIAAPQSASGKTTVTLGLLRALSRQGADIRSAKAGPDFIDPAFHRAATGRECVNLDPWAMRSELLQFMAGQHSGLVVIEAMMGLFDGAADGSGSAADLANLLNVPVILVVDASRQSHSIAALVQGFNNYRQDINIAAVILNNVGSPRHESMLRDALATIAIPVFGAIRRNATLKLPSRHLGLVQAREHSNLEVFLDAAADIMETSVDLKAIVDQAALVKSGGNCQAMRPPGQRVAVAHDDCFAFLYPHLVDGWRSVGAELMFFSPMKNQAPAHDCDAVYLPGGYPELHADVLSSCDNFMRGLRQAAERGAFVYGECGGYMVLGDFLVDAAGERHEMAGLLPLTTSFESRKLNLGYRLATSLTQLPFCETGETLTAHEFHYSTIVNESGGQALLDAVDARGESLGHCGLRCGNVAGSYLHVIDHRPAPETS